MATSFILQRAEVSTLEEGKDEDSESDQEVNFLSSCSRGTYWSMLYYTNF